MNKKLSKLVQFFCIILGNVIIAFSIAAFSIPNQFLVVGGTGMARVLEYFFSLPMFASVAVINAVMFFIGLYFLGREFAVTTIISTFLFPMLLDIFMNIEILAHLTDDKLLAAVLSGILPGAGLGIVIRAGASTGGFDIPPLILKNKLRIPVAVSVYAMSAAVLCAQMFFSEIEQVLYGILSTLITSVVLDKVLVSGSGNVETFILSNKYADINHMIQTKLDKGSTLIPIQTGHRGEEWKAIMCVLPARELGRFALKRTAENLYLFDILLCSYRIYASSPTPPNCA